MNVLGFRLLSLGFSLQGLRFRFCSDVCRCLCLCEVGVKGFCVRGSGLKFRVLGFRVRVLGCSGIGFRV